MSEPEDPKIIVDEDWKSRVEKEREELRQQEADSQQQEDVPSADIPEASFQVLLATLATQAMAMLGILPNPDGSGPTEANLPMARHLIDMIGVLDEKTKGNLTDEEAGMMTEHLHQLRMAFIAISKQGGNSAPPASETPSTGSIELP